MTHPELALERILESMRALGGEDVALRDAAGRIASEDVAARRRLPAIDRAAADGFAVLSGDVEAAAPGAPALLALRDRLALADDGEDLDRVPGGAVRLRAGSALPDGADAVVAAGEAELDGPLLRVLAPARPGARIQRMGSDVLAGEVLAERGQRLRASDVGLLAAQGLERVAVFRRASVALLEAGPDAAPASAAAYAVLARSEARPEEPIALDDENPVLAVTEAAAARDAVVLVPGPGASCEALDSILLSAGLDPAARGLAIEPDGSFLFGLLGGRPVWRLPPSPVAAWICAAEFVRPAIRVMQGEGREPGTPSLEGTLETDARKDAARQAYWLCAARQVEGRWRLRPVRAQGAHQLGALRLADALAWAPIGPGLMRAGAALRFRFLE